MAKATHNEAAMANVGANDKVPGKGRSNESAATSYIWIPNSTKVKSGTTSRRSSSSLASQSKSQRGRNYLIFLSGILLEAFIGFLPSEFAAYRSDIVNSKAVGRS
jgi:hypothetical protein